MRSPIVHKWIDLRLILASETETTLSSFDFLNLGLHPSISESLARCFIPVVGHTSLESQRQSWRSLRKFAKHRIEVGKASDAYFDKATLQDFASWLEDSDLTGSTSQSHYNFVERVIKWCFRNVPEEFPKGLCLKRVRFKREMPKTRSILTGEEQKRVLTICYHEIKQIEELLMKGRRILNGEVLDESEEIQRKLLHELLCSEDGFFIRQRDWRGQYAHISRALAQVGSIVDLWSLLWPTPKSVFPFYLAIQIQTSGNPMSIAELSVDCIRDHPIREDLERLVWYKPRSHAEQKVDFPKRFENSAPNLVRRYAELSAGIRNRATSRYKNDLFICSSPKTRKVRVPSVQSFHNFLKEFIDKHELRDFDFKDNRITGAKSHHLAARKMEAARILLNHKRLVTTQGRYTSLEDRASEHAEVIRKFQGMLIAESRALGTALSARTELPKNPSSRDSSSSVFGFQCKDPFAGIAPASAKGKRCMHFTGCSTCPGAIIVLDDIDNVAHLLAARKALLETKAQSVRSGWLNRFSLLYAPTLEILEKEILPAIHPDIYILAEKRMSLFPMPVLE